MAAVWLLAVSAAGPVAQAAHFLIPVPGVVKEAVTVRHDNRNRRVVFLRRVQPLAGNALVPAIIALHYAGGDPESMANLTAISKLVRDTGIWAILPEARGRSWSTDPVRDANGPDDVGLLTADERAFGTEPVLAEADKLALVEYLKTL